MVRDNKKLNKNLPNNTKMFKLILLESIKMLYNNNKRIHKKKKNNEDRQTLEDILIT